MSAPWYTTLIGHCGSCSHFDAGWCQLRNKKRAIFDECPKWIRQSGAEYPVEKQLSLLESAQ